MIRSRYDKLELKWMNKYLELQAEFIVSMQRLTRQTRKNTDLMEHMHLLQTHIISLDKRIELLENEINKGCKS